MSGNNRNKKIRSPKIIFARNPELGVCPSCGEKGTLKRSKPRSAWERIVKTLSPFHYYRCRKCGWRGPILKYKMTGDSFKNLALYFLLALVTAFVVRFVIVKLIMK